GYVLAACHLNKHCFAESPLRCYWPGISIVDFPGGFSIHQPGIPPACPNWVTSPTRRSCKIGIRSIQWSRSRVRVKLWELTKVDTLTRHPAPELDCRFPQY